MGAKLAAARQALHQRLGRRRHRLHRHGLRDRRARAHPDPVDPAQQLLDGDRAADHAGRDREVPHAPTSAATTPTSPARSAATASASPSRTRSSRRSSAASRRRRRARRRCWSSSPRRRTLLGVLVSGATCDTPVPVGFSGGARGRGVGGRPGLAVRHRTSPESGGELIFLVPSEPPSYDGHREGTFGMVHPLAPHYNTLLRIDPTDRTGTRPFGRPGGVLDDRARRPTYTFKLRQGVRFHDGSAMTSRDVKASYDKIIFPPAGVTSMRKGSYQVVEVVEAPDPHTVRFRLKWPEASFLVSLASPYNWIIKADILAKDIRWYETNVMGTGPVQVRRARARARTGSARRTPTTGTRASPTSTAIGRFSSPRRRPRWPPSAASAPTSSSAASARRTATRSCSALGPKITVQESPWNCVQLVDDEPRAQALRRQARPPGPDPRARPLRGVQDPVAHRGREGGRRHPGAGHAVGDAAGRAGEAGRLRARHRPPTGPRRGGCCARPACPTASPSRSRTGGSRSPTSRSRSGSSTSGGRSD